MRSIKEAYSIKKHNLVIGEWYGILLDDGMGGNYEWIFRFAGLNERNNYIMSDKTYNHSFNGWNYNGDNVGILCEDHEMIKGSIRKYSENDVKEILDLQ